MLASKLKFAIWHRRFAALSGSAAAKELQLGLLIDSQRGGFSEMLENLRKELKISEKDFQILLCRDKNGEANLSEYPVLSGTDLSWKNLPLQANVEDFLSRKYKYLVSFCHPENKLAALIVSNICAAVKIGRAAEKETLEGYDLSIMVSPDDQAVFVQEVEKFIKIFNKEKHE